MRRVGMPSLAPRAADLALNHTGSNTYWFANLWVAPNRERAYVAVTNSAESDLDQTREMLDSIIESLIESHSVMVRKPAWWPVTVRHQLSRLAPVVRE